MADETAGRPWLRPPDRGDRRLIAAYFAVIVLAYLAGVAAGTLIEGDPTLHPFVYRPLLFPVLFTAAPPVLAAANALRGGTLSGSLAVGLVPGAAFLVLAGLSDLFGFGQGDAPAWVLSLAAAVAGLVAAVVGVAVARLIERVAAVAAEAR